MIGETFRVQIADGYAYYKVVDEGTWFKGDVQIPMVQVEVQPDPQYGEVDYVGHFGASCWIEADLIHAKIQGEKRLAEIFGPGPKGLKDAPAS